MLTISTILIFLLSILLLSRNVQSQNTNFTEPEAEAILIDLGYPRCVTKCFLYALTTSPDCPVPDSTVECICTKGYNNIFNTLIKCLTKNDEGCTGNDYAQALAAASGPDGCAAYRTTFLPNNATIANLTSNLTIPSRPPQPTLTPLKTDSPPPARKLSKGAYAGIGISAAIAGGLALGLAIFWRVHRRRKGRKELERKYYELFNDHKDLVELAGEYKKPVEMEGDHGVSEAPVQPQELDSTEVGLRNNEQEP